MWSITAFDITHLRSPGGDRFTEFVDALIRAQGFVCSIPYAEIHTNLRTNIPDGGVDTRVSIAAVNDVVTGWLADRTIWQYKATEAKSIRPKNLRDEINKDYAKKCILEGYAYRFCICDELEAPKKQEWESKLTQYAQAINPNVPPAKVLAAGDLAAWAGHFPAIILRFFRPDIAGIALHINAWRENVITYTPNFVPVSTWEPVQKDIREHINLSIPPAEVVLSIQGEAGVGKTRMVYETLAEISALENLTIYTNDEQYAQQIMRQLANDRSLNAILVADECSVQTRIQLLNLAQGHRSRIRIVAIDNTGERPLSGAAEYWIQQVSDEILEKILEQNFSYVPTERRRAYASLSGGFVRLAADMCIHDSEIAASGHVGPVLGSIRNYYRSRLSEEEQRVLEALVLMSRVGFKGDVAEELENLCLLVNVEQAKMLDIAHKLHDIPGFVARAGRFFYITPEIIAQVAFEGAWRRWGEADPEGFLGRISGSLLEPFLKRVGRSASEEVRRLIGDFFLNWATKLNPTDLANVTKVDRLVILLDTNPDTYLPILRGLVERASQEELLAIIGEGYGRWGPRRHLVWFAERISAFPQYFDHAESILLRLAITETEPSIGNNATAIWLQLFRIYLSGTAVPFLERLNKLEKRIYSDDEQISRLALDALSSVFNLHGMRMAGPPVVAGRIPPEEWHPKNRREEKICLDAAFTLLYRLSMGDYQAHREKAYGIAVEHMRTLLWSGYLNKLRDMFSVDMISDELRIQVISRIEEFIRYDHQKISSQSSLPTDYVEELKSWLETLKTGDFHSRLVTTIGVDPWHHSILGDEGTWQKEIQSLAGHLHQNPDILERELEWLCSKNAKSAVILGQKLGKQDPEGLLLNTIFESALRFQTAALGKGYIYSLLDIAPWHSVRLNMLLDKIESDAPGLAYELFMAGGEATNALERALGLVEVGKLPVTFLNSFSRGIGSRPLHAQEFRKILERFVGAVEHGNTDAVQVAIMFVAFRLEDDKKQAEYQILDHEEIVALIWRLLEATVDYAGTESFWWGRILDSLVVVNPERAAKIAVAALVGERLSHRDEAIKVLSRIASEYPDVVMEQLGQAIMDEEKGWHFFIGKYDRLIQSLPKEIIINWVQSEGVEGARRLARHLPAPYLDKDGRAIVPPLTEFVLKTFEEDDRVFTEFCVGVHSLQMYSGDIAAQHEKEAEMAKKFLNHSLRRVREWADYEVRHSLSSAEWARQRHEELDIE
ncbi:MAG: hypothetical protein BroJett011_43720 [Chloroflexota bacterium]|nr:MAG: hypothetical protein BroJett011_43720 [Chloroflexota bacterium]